MTDLPAAEAGGKASSEARLAARRLALEAEMEAAPYHRLGTTWWDERVEELKLIKRRLGP
jgi:hypothetical protein